MNAMVKIKLTPAEKKEAKIKDLIEIRGGLINKHHRLDVNISKNLHSYTLSAVIDEKKKIRKLATHIKRVTGRLKKLGVNFEE